MEKQRNNQENQDTNIWDDHTLCIIIPVRIGILDNAKTRWEKESYSKNELAKKNCRVSGQQKIWNRDIRQALGSLTTLLPRGFEEAQ